MVFFFLLLHFFLPPRTSDFFQFCDVAQVMMTIQKYIYLAKFIYFLIFSQTMKTENIKTPFHIVGKILMIFWQFFNKESVC
jgi:hypothetical protein